MASQKSVNLLLVYCSSSGVTAKQTTESMRVSASLFSLATQLTNLVEPNPPRIIESSIFVTRNINLKAQQIVACPLELVMQNGYVWISRDVTQEVTNDPVNLD